MAETDIEILEPQPDNLCVGCGGANPRGLRLRFELDRARKRATARLRLDPSLQGSSGMAHGGIIALLLDEAMGKLNRLYGVRAVTAELDVAYLRPVPTGEEIVVEAATEGREGRNLRHSGEIRDAAGRVLARSRARFVAVGERPATDPRPAAGPRQSGEHGSMAKERSPHA